MGKQHLNFEFKAGGSPCTTQQLFRRVAQRFLAPGFTIMVTAILQLLSSPVYIANGNLLRPDSKGLLQDMLLRPVS